MDILSGILVAVLLMWFLLELQLWYDKLIIESLFFTNI